MKQKFGYLGGHKVLCIVFHDTLIVESDSTNAIPWVSSPEDSPWKIQIYLNESHIE